MTERDGVFRPGQHKHNHTVEVGAATAAKIVSRVKNKALEDKFKSASAIVDEVTIHSFSISLFSISTARLVGTEEVNKTHNHKNGSFRSHQVCERK